MKQRFVLFFVVPAFLIVLNINAQQANWTHFRGSNLNGISEATNPPVTWGISNNIKWRTDLTGKGWSSPVVLGDQIWLTTATEDGKNMKVVCLDFKTGRIIHDILLFSPDSLESKHSINTYATPTPCIEDGFVYIHFGTYGTACLKTADGKLAWKRTLTEM